MKITIRIEDTYTVNQINNKRVAELIYDEPTIATDYPKIVTKDKYDFDTTKSKRLIDAISELVDQAIKAVEVNKEKNENEKTDKE